LSGPRLGRPKSDPELLAKEGLLNKARPVAAQWM
jgi:hypothetical protein